MSKYVKKFGSWDEAKAANDLWSPNLSGLYTDEGTKMFCKSVGEGVKFKFVGSSMEDFNYATLHSVTNNLSHATTSNPASQASQADKYEATITPDEGYHVTYASVKMNGSDITSTAYSEGKVTIDSVTGPIVITVTTQGTLYELQNAANYEFNPSLPRSVEKGSSCVEDVAYNDYIVSYGLSVTMSNAGATGDIIGRCRTVDYSPVCEGCVSLVTTAEGTYLRTTISNVVSNVSFDWGKYLVLWGSSVTSDFPFSSMPTVIGGNGYSYVLNTTSTKTVNDLAYTKYITVKMGDELVGKVQLIDGTWQTSGVCSLSDDERVVINITEFTNDVTIAYEDAPVTYSVTWTANEYGFSPTPTSVSEGDSLVSTMTHNKLRLFSDGIKVKMGGAIVGYCCMRYGATDLQTSGVVSMTGGWESGTITINIPEVTGDVVIEYYHFNITWRTSGTYDFNPMPSTTSHNATLGGEYLVTTGTFDTTTMTDDIIVLMQNQETGNYDQIGYYDHANNQGSGCCGTSGGYVTINITDATGDIIVDKFNE